MAKIDPARVDEEWGSIEEREREDERRAAEREAAQTESIVNAMTKPPATPG